MNGSALRRGFGAAVIVAMVAVAGCGEPSAATSPPPTLGPEPSPIPTAAPTRVDIPLPASIDPTGTADASAALMSFLATVPDNSTVRFPTGGVFRMDLGLRFSNRHDLTFERSGATLEANGAITCGRDCSLFYLDQGNTGITIRDFTLAGNSPTPGVYDHHWEHASGITVVGGRDVEIAYVTISGVGGDGLTISGGSAPDWPDGVWFHDSRVVSSGRNGVAVISGGNVTVERVVFPTSNPT